jgi:hypothetical protein
MEEEEERLRTGPIKRNRSFYHSVHELLRLLLFLLRLEQNKRMEVPIPNMSHYRRNQTHTRYIPFGIIHQLRKLGHRNAEM